MQRIPIGVSDFEEIRTDNYYFVDKSMFIADVVRGGAKVTLLPRPRRFGKTLNLNMLKSFFDMGKKDNRSLFQGLAVYEHEDVMAHCGVYPVVYLTFKDLKFSDYEQCYGALSGILSKLFLKHAATLEAANLRGIEKKWVEAIMEGEADVHVYQNSLTLLSELLHRATGRKVIILIDEYDMPIHGGYHYGYYQEIIQFMGNLLSGAFKDNDHLEKGVLTGIMRIAKESIFSGFNNPRVCTVLDIDFSQHFGFTPTELDKILADFNLEHCAREAREWYNGYQFGNQTIYNPWSIMQFLTSAQHGDIQAQPHWVNTSDNLLIRKLITEQSALSRTDLQTLLSGGSVHKELETNIVLSDITAGSLWSMLTLSGYLTSQKTVVMEGVHHCDLVIPNLEVQTFFKSAIRAWSNEQTGPLGLNSVIDALVAEDMPRFAYHFSEAVRHTLSYHDTAGNVPERVYHVFLLGMLVNLQKDYHVRSNRESGLGRYDILLTPKDLSKTGFIFEFKQKETDPQKTALAALDQIRANDYGAELRQAGVTTIRAVGVAMCGKQAAVETALLDA